MSVNKKPLEEELGVDLLYWDELHDAFTFLQYKRLERIESPASDGGPEWAYRRKAELKKQLALMPKGRGLPKTAADWRAFDTPFWFKFVRGDAARKLDGKVLKGMYVPADWLRLAIDDSALQAGPRGGFRLTFSNTKYLGRSSFIQLLSRAFIGTAGARSKSFQKVMENLGTNRELIIAIRSEWQQPTIEDLPGAEVPSAAPF